jgi:hypothetical protein
MNKAASSSLVIASRATAHPFEPMARLKE